MSSLEFCLYERMAACSGSGATPHSLRHEAIFGSRVAAGFFWRQVLREASDEPWCLTVGDVKANLKKLGPRKLCLQT